MRKDIIRSAIVIVASTVVLGLIYPAVMVLFGQVVFSSQANGSLITRNGKTVGSKLAAQSFNGPRYFHERPSAGRLQRRRHELLEPRPEQQGAARHW